MSSPEKELLELARDAAGRGEWQEALVALVDADANTPLGVSDLALLASVAYAAGRIDVTIGSWERAYAESVRAGDHLRAAEAAVRVALHLVFDTALMAPVRAWTRQAERFLESQPETSVHAWLAVVRNYERLLSGDFERARQWARQAIEIGARCDPAAAAMGRLAEARGLILAGEVTDGLSLLNDAALAVVSGELDPLSTGIVYCELVCGLQALAQYDLAEEWTVAMERWRHGQPVGSIHGRCRVHRAEILRLRGDYVGAEREALAACEELRPYLRREFGWPLTELGRIRLRKGDIPGAEEAFLAAHEAGWDPQPGLALVYLARGEAALAVASIRVALEDPLSVPSKELPPNTDLRRAPLLEAQVEIEVAAGNLARARAAADELTRIAGAFASTALVAGAALARGRVALAGGDTAHARRELEQAARLWNQVGAPYEAALARMGLAGVHLAEGNVERAALELQVARMGFERVGAMHMAAQATQACSDAGPNQASDPDRYRVTAPRDDHVFRREGDSWAVMFDGRSAHLRDLKGFRYLACLLAAPGREFHVLDLVAAQNGSPVRAEHIAEAGLTVRHGLSFGPALDVQAKEAYRRRLVEIDEDIEEARELGDDGRVAQAESERDFLIRELARAVGLGGRDRRLGSDSERARASVTRAVRKAMVRIGEHHPALGEHLDRAIRTGTWCVYQPDPRSPLTWKL